MMAFPELQEKLGKVRGDLGCGGEAGFQLQEMGDPCFWIPQGVIGGIEAREIAVLRDIRVVGCRELVEFFL